MKKTGIVIVAFFICFFTLVSNAGSWGSGHVYIKVRDYSYRPVSWAYVALDGSTCSNRGGGYYRITTSIGQHTVYVSGKHYNVYVGSGYTLVNAYIP